MPDSDHILVVDDDPEIRDLLARYLGRNGYRVSAAADGRAMSRALAAARIDLVVLDLMLPGRDGLELTRDLRAGSNVPIIMVTARGDETDRIVGLEIGADDYLAKPFNPRELLARIKSVLRRSRTLAAGDSARGTRYRFAGWTLDVAARELTSPKSVHVTLTGREFDLLTAFVEHAQRMLSRDQLMDLTSGREHHPFDRSIDVLVGRLRRRIESDPRHPQLIKTVRGGGYTLAAQVTRL